MFELTFLGTSASAPSIERGLAAALLQHQDHRFLIDCGEGTQRQLLCSGLGFKKLNQVLLTHGHLDHILGLGGLISTFARWEAIPSLTIYGGRWALERVRDLIEGVVFRGEDPQIALEYHPVETGVVWQSEHLTLSAFPVHHRGPGCYGYIFQEMSKRPFLAEAAEALGVPNGPERKKLVQGEPITLRDGRIVLPEQVLGPEIPGVKLVYVGDAGRIDNLVEPCSGADALVIEATYTEEEADLASKFGHLTAKSAAELARAAGVKALYLTHLSRRYSARMIGEEAERVFPDTFVARDFDHVRVLAVDRAPTERVSR